MLNPTKSAQNTSAHTIIAEIGTSDGGDIYHAKELIDAAAESGANCIKFQWVIANELVPRNAGKISLPSGMVDIRASFVHAERKFDFYAELKHYSERKGLAFLCSVFGLQSLDLLLRLQPSCIKIASPEVNYLALIQKLSTCAHHLNKEGSNTNPYSLILSDGIATYVDIANALAHIQGIPTTLLRCVTQYPARPSDYQLSRLQYYAALFPCQVGISDHTEDPCFIPALATLLGSNCTEKHFTLSKTNAGLDDSFALTPDEFALMAKAIYSAEHLAVYHAPLHIDSIQKIMQNICSDTCNDIAFSIEDSIASKGCSATFLPIYYSTRRSLFSAKPIAKGNVLDESNITMLRSETNIKAGISAEHFAFIRGKSAQTDIAVDCPIAWEHIANYANMPLYSA